MSGHGGRGGRRRDRRGRRHTRGLHRARRRAGQMNRPDRRYRIGPGVRGTACLRVGVGRRLRVRGRRRWLRTRAERRSRRRGRLPVGWRARRRPTRRRWPAIRPPGHLTVRWWRHPLGRGRPCSGRWRWPCSRWGRPIIGRRLRMRVRAARPERHCQQHAARKRQTPHRLQVTALPNCRMPKV